jgi:hypothetical protein
VRSAFVNLVKSCDYIALKVRIHVDGCCSRSLRLRFSEMLLSE